MAVGAAGATLPDWVLLLSLPPAQGQDLRYGCRQGGGHLGKADTAQPLEASAAQVGTGWPVWDWLGAPGTGLGPGALFPPPGSPVMKWQHWA